MSITSNSGRDELIEWSKQILDAIRARQAPAVIEGVNQAANGLLRDRFVLTVLGKAKRGKSTLLNAMLGRKDDTVAPVDKLPASSAISRFRWAETEQATVVYRDGHRETIGFDRIREFVTEECNKENFKGVDVVEIAGPFSSLDRDLELVDTPGAGSIHEHHDAILHAFIPQSDAVIFLVTARMPLDQDELDLLQKVQSADIGKVFFAVNRVDECSEKDIEDAISHNRHLLAQIGVQVDRMHRVSAKRAFQGDPVGSGVVELEQEIGAFLASSKGRVLSARFVSRVCSAVEPVLQAIDVQVASSRKSVTQLDTELASLRQTKRTIEAERQFAEREFISTWSRVTDAYVQGLKDAQSAVSAAIASKVENCSLVGVSAMAKQLPTLLTRTIEENLRPVAFRFESAAREACDRLQASYPELNVCSAGTVAFRTREGYAAVTGSAAGVAVAATGVGLAAAGATVAASVAAANAAAAAAVATVAAPSLLSGVLTFLGLDILAPLATGTATVAAPAAMATTPLWVALAGPIGWTLAGIGVLAVPFSWRLSKVKLKDKIEDAGQEQVSKVFSQLMTERLPAIRNMGKAIAEEIRLHLDRQLEQIESAMVAARDHRPSELEVSQLEDMAARTHSLIRDCGGRYFPAGTTRTAGIPGSWT